MKKVYVGMGTDHTLFAKVAGLVRFVKKGAHMRQYVFIEPVEVAE